MKLTRKNDLWDEDYTYFERRQGKAKVERIMRRHERKERDMERKAARYAKEFMLSA